MSQPIPALVSRTRAEAATRAKSLYRAFLRVRNIVCLHGCLLFNFSFPNLPKAAPVIIARYELGFSVPQVRTRITQEFAKNKQLHELSAIDFQIFRGATELTELLEQWKTKSHVLNYFAVPKESKSDLFSSFFARG